MVYDCDHSHASGIYRGVVVAVNDPEDKGRVKLRVPQLLGKTATDWAWPKDVASVRLGPPKVGQGVWVMFEGGDLAFPVWVGTFGKLPTGQVVPSLSPLAEGTSLSTAAPYIVTKTVNGVTEVDLLATVISLANKVAELNTRVTALEGMP